MFFGSYLKKQVVSSLCVSSPVSSHSCPSLCCVPPPVCPVVVWKCVLDAPQFTCNGVTLSSLLRFDTRIGGLTFTDQFLSISTVLPSKNVYGLGENAHDSFRHAMDGSVWPLFSRDEGPVPQVQAEAFCGRGGTFITDCVVH